MDQKIGTKNGKKLDQKWKKMTKNLTTEIGTKKEYNTSSFVLFLFSEKSCGRGFLLVESGLENLVSNY